MSKYVQATDLEHMRNQTAMYLGGKAIIQSVEYTIDKKMLKTLVNLSPAACKCFDEILVNAIDQNTLHGANIYVNWLPDNTFVVENDTSSIDIYTCKTCDGREMLSIKMIFGEFKTSSNFTGGKFTGGIFGIGAKGANAFSELFKAETCDGKQYAMVQWNNCMSKVTEPLVENDPGDKFTRITCKLNFTDFGLTKAEDLATFKSLCYYRVMQTAVFVYPKKVYWQDEEVKMDLYSWCNLVSAGRKIQILGKNWNVMLWIGDEFTQSLVNGIYVKEGTHIDYIKNQLLEYIKPRWQEIKDPKCKVLKLSKELDLLKKQKEDAKNSKDKTLLAKLTEKEKEIKAKIADAPKFDKRYVDKYISIMIKCYMEKPSYTGQRKDKIDSPIDPNTLILDDSKLEDFWSLLKPLIEFDILEKTTVEKKPQKVKTKKYTPAKNLGLTASLLLSEGDSADGTLVQGLSNKDSQANFENYGTFSVQGVIMNAEKQTDEVENPLSGESIIVRSQKLQANVRLAMLVQILNLDFKKMYKTDTELKTLNYGCVIIATDQDEDGKGNIRSLIVAFFLKFWPDLVRRGYLKYLMTPIVRAFNTTGKEPIKEFYTEKEYKEWSQEPRKGWEVVYYKGLGSHGKDEIAHMFRRFNSLVVTLTLDEKTILACEAYFGKDTSVRKIILKKPPKRTEEDCIVVQHGVKYLSTTDHFNTSTKSFQIYNISRHIKHVIDGGLPSKRKIWAGARKKLNYNNQRIKVYQLGGDIAKSMNYHHGDNSLTSTITGETQDFPGMHEFPMLLPLSMSGTRRKGGLDAGKPRYIFTKLNKHLSDALFPLQDDYILDYTFDDNQRGEPVFYVPVVPLAILENYTSPGHGWKCTTWARDFWEISAHLRKCLKEGKFIKPEEDFSFTKRRFRHDIDIIKGVEYSIGKWEINRDILKITELPVRIWNEHYLRGHPDKANSVGIVDKDFVVGEPVDTSTENEINIEIKCSKSFNLGAKTRDEIIKEFGLKQSLSHQLNFIGVDNTIQSFDYYWQIFEIWFAIRQEYYIKRIQRLSILTRLKIVQLEQQLLYVAKRESLNLSSKTKKEQNEILKIFTKIDHGMLDHPSYTPCDKLEDLILRGDNASYEYLRKMDADDLSDEGVASLKEKLEKSRALLADLSAPNANITLHLRELETLEAVVRKGHSEGWLAWEPKKVWDSSTQ